MKNIDIVCDLVGIANDPSSDLNKDYSKIINCDARYNFAKIAKNCSCTFECANAISTVYDKRNWPSLL